MAVQSSEPHLTTPCSFFERYMEIIPSRFAQKNVPEQAGGSFKTTASGYFVLDPDPSPAKDAVILLSKNGAPAIWCNLNQINPSLLARSNNELTFKPDATSRDEDIVRRTAILFDFDPVRPSGISATDSELRAASKLATRTKQQLSLRGWPRPIIAMSGNGVHLIYRIDLPNDPGSLELVSNVLCTADQLFSDECVKLDTSTANAGQLVKIAGTWARKGSNMADRPHRQSFFGAPAEVETVSEEQLQSFAALMQQRTPSKSSGTPLRRTKRFSIDRWLAANDVPVNDPQSYGQGGRKWTFAALPKPCEAHGHTHDGSAFIIEREDGVIQAGCHHKGCTWNWHDLRNTYGNEQVVIDDSQYERPIPFGELLKRDLTVKHLIRGKLAADRPCIIAGPSKAMKTTLACFLSCSLVSGEKFMGRWTVESRQRVLFASAESSLAVLRDNLRGAAGQMSIKLEVLNKDLHVCPWVPRIEVDEMLDAFIANVRNLAATVVILDPVYMMLSDTTPSLILTGQQLATLCDEILALGATPILLDHVKRGSDNAKRYQPLELEDISGAGKAEYFRQWILISRRERFEPFSDEAIKKHRLWLSFGGDAGQSGLYGVDLTEAMCGFSDTDEQKQYSLDVMNKSELAEAKATEKDLKKKTQVMEKTTKRKADAEKIIQAMQQRRERICSKSEIGRVTGLGRRDVDGALEYLTSRGHVETVVGAVQGGHPGYQISTVAAEDATP